MKRIISVLICSFFVLSACKSTHRVAISGQEYLVNYKAIVLTGFSMPDALEYRTDIRDYYASKVTDIFESRGIKVFDESLYFDEFEKQKALAGGYIDEYTGKVDTDKRNQIRQKTLQSLRATHGIDSVLFYDLRRRTAHFGDYRAQWDGQEEPYELSNSDLTNFLSTLVANTSGKIPALSLMVFMEDMDGKELYMGAGGVQLVAKLNDDDEFESIPVDKLLRDEAKLDFSVEEAFRKLFND
ncbi:hypothetical protein LJ739_11305 [Aestuariibacter halophilus]|uniref:Uncharacterized protein n=1 Tax=Fluctibacter halophilus TaxID=226011 RepID=A0ABS8G8C7_9ALTE|nr:hypothetical protein [Aestuariibacter halophilus]MCC2616829.1 hypothetical protein [Aestuariibacter halophilus]